MTPEVWRVTTLAWYSKAPMSQPRPAGRPIPLWSVMGLARQSPASMAGLPGNKAMVSVHPPLLRKTPKRASCPKMFPTKLPAMLQPVGSWMRLCPPEVMAPLQSAHAFPIVSELTFEV
jgi:hypothetical protein